MFYYKVIILWIFFWTQPASEKTQLPSSASDTQFPAALANRIQVFEEDRKKRVRVNFNFCETFYLDGRS